MAVTPGNILLQADMNALAALANGKSSLPHDARWFSDTFGNPYQAYFVQSVTIVAPGTGYNIGDALVDPGNISFAGNGWAAVTAVNATGGVTGLEITYNWQFMGELTNPVALDNKSGSGNGVTVNIAWLTPARVNYSFARPANAPPTFYNPFVFSWMFEITRLRANLATLFPPDTGYDYTIPDPRIFISGPWPVIPTIPYDGGANLFTSQGPWPYKDLAFYFADPGNAVTVTFLASVTVAWPLNDPAPQTTEIGPISWSSAEAVPGIHNSKSILKISVGNVADFYSRVTTSTPPLPTIVINGGFTMQDGNGNPVVGFWAATTFFSNLNPVPTSAMPWNITFQRGGVSVGIGAGSEDIGAGDEDIGAGDLSTIIANILCNPMIGVPAAIGSKSFPRLSYDHSLPLEEQYEPPRWKAACWFDFGNTIWDSNGNVQTCTTAGLTGLNEPGWSLSLNSTLTETVAAPATGATWTLTQKVNTGLPDTWGEGVFYERGDTVQDTNGNTQTAESWLPLTPCSLSDFTAYCTDSNNNTQQLVTAGTTGATEPVWNTVLNGLTNDGSCVWQLVYKGSSMYSGAVEPTWSKTPGAITNDFMVNWKLTAANPGKMVTPAMHRQLLNTGALQSQPKYPAYWFSETIARLMPPAGATDAERTVFGTGSQWTQWQTSNALDGCWIYSVALNRLGTPGAVSLPQSGQVAVTLGCMRNGSFVAFGTYNTGQKINVLWPIFTSDALVYQCSERVDVQALAIQNVSQAWDVSHPLCAAHINDTIALMTQ
jgi:hypothetical protein